MFKNIYTIAVLALFFFVSSAYGQATWDANGPHRSINSGSGGAVSLSQNGTVKVQVDTTGAIGLKAATTLADAAGTPQALTAGAISGTTGTFSGLVKGVGITAANAAGTPAALAAGTGAFSGDVSIATQKSLVQPVYVPTMAATPVAGTNVYLGTYNVVPTAAANTSAFLEATPVAGQVKSIFNDSVNAVRISAGGVSTINGGAAGGYIPLATKQLAECRNANGTNWTCGLLSVPTPAGP